MSKNTKSEIIIAKVRETIGNAQYAGLYGIALAKAFQNTLVDVDGMQYTDFLAAASSVTLGYAREDIIQAYVESARNLVHSCFVYSPNLDTLRLAEKMIQITPGDFNKKVMFGMSASDSIDGAIKASRKYTGKMGVIAFNNAYHGNTGLSAQATGFPGIRNGFLEGTNFSFLDFPTTEEAVIKCLSEAESMFKAGDIACFIIEPIQGDGGNLVPPDSFFQKLLELTRKYDIVLIDDETQSGVGRTGKWWAIEHFKIAPDLMVSGKGLSGGYAPISVCVGRQEIIDSLSKAQHVFTYSGHPPSSAVVSQVIKVIEEENILNQVKKKGEWLSTKLQEVCEKYQKHLKCEVRGIGLQIGLAIQHPQEHSLAALFGARCLDKGIYVGYFGQHNNVLRIHPPLTITQPEMEKLITTLDQVFTEWIEKKIPSETIERYHTHCLGLGQN